MTRAAHALPAALARLVKTRNRNLSACSTRKSLREGVRLLKLSSTALYSYASLHEEAPPLTTLAAVESRAAAWRTAASGGEHSTAALSPRRLLSSSLLKGIVTRAAAIRAPH